MRQETTISEEALQRFPERINSDAEFRDHLQSNPDEALAGVDLSPVEGMALALRDEDALRRLAGTDVSGYMAPGGPAGGSGVVWDPYSVGRLGSCTKVCLLFTDPNYTCSADPGDCRYVINPQ